MKKQDLIKALNPTQEIDEMHNKKVKDLRVLAKENKIKYYTKLNKYQLIDKLKSINKNLLRKRNLLYLL